MEQGMTKRAKALIIGGGIAGPVTGIFLNKAVSTRKCFEAWPYSTGIGGGLQIAPNGMHVLAEIGLADDMIRQGSIADPSTSIRRKAPCSVRSTATCASVSGSPRSTCAAPR